MEWLLHVNWDKSYSFIPICILLVCIMTIMSNNLWKKKCNLLSLHFYLLWCVQYGKSFYFLEMKQGIHLLFRTQKQPKENWNGFSTLIETKVILVSLFVFCLCASSQLCRIIYRKKSNLLSHHFYFWWCMQYGRSFCLGVEARNPSSFLEHKKQPKRK